jgi:hypothetical protein
MKSDTNSSNERRKELANARWAILRDALLQKSGNSSSQHQQQCSIHRFGGYNLLKSRPAEQQTEIGRVKPFLEKFTWRPSDDSSQNLHWLEIAILGLAACFPQGHCLQVIIGAETHDNEANWFETLKKICDSSVCIWKVKEEHDGNEIVTTILVQEGKNSTKYDVCLYDLTFSSEKAGGSLSLWTREPRQSRLSLDDLVSHRKNKGVDNTGNICVWDSERTLAYLLYNHFDDFTVTTGEGNSTHIIADDKKDLHVLELGTGMAGLAAVTLGLRLVVGRHKHAIASVTENRIKITLTDGNPNGVKNNMINQYLTRLHSESKPTHPIRLLDVSCKLLLWSTDMASPGDKTVHRSDIVLVSDCAHFQNFHAALAITMIRCLKVHGTAIFCQPARGNSLDNFFRLVNCTSASLTERGPLVSCSWWSHPVIEQKHAESVTTYKGIYDESLHHPKILLVRKVRDMTEEDRLEFIIQQRSRPSSLGIKNCE